MQIHLKCLPLTLGVLMLTLPAWAARLEDQGNGTVYDYDTGLTWQQQDDGATKNWATAGTYCQNLSLGGKSDWRLPNIKELSSIVDYRKPSPGPTISRVMFPNTHSLSYWSASSDVANSSDAWRVSFNTGSVVTRPKASSSGNYVRCVR